MREREKEKRKKERERAFLVNVSTIYSADAAEGMLSQEEAIIERRQRSQCLFRGCFAAETVTMLFHLSASCTTSGGMDPHLIC